ncbi:hypothetical protein HanXRQr2_Chr02g0057611 [Helianthus annuus]|uniref:Cytochrome P450 n=1 Tax=Helianthus annuus TaxID=4232 RepID=A0A9K3JMW1_HELAN|nr:hypothetical protein HanXRQr2_Chr02g0057611 [Helianthus annuus]KAJ0618268.1 hypothetical protein HanHA89_Chr02g0051211 [Helianthus annuus]KAJ0776730.1 hypothetical protein HanLR1_Chr02g0048971 [Helianthus annuus]KAJ0951191.1 hypothetical protein HanPSC8_Chr02g0057051 [Helianthus annuus]
MGGEVLPIILLSCVRAGGGRVSAHLGEPLGWRRSSSRPWPQRPVSHIQKKKKNLVVPKNKPSKCSYIYSHKPQHIYNSTMYYSPELVVLSLPILSLFFYVLFINQTKSKSKEKEAPEPRGDWPIIGHLHLLGGGDKLLYRMLDYSGVFTGHGSVRYRITGTGQLVRIRTGHGLWLWISSLHFVWLKKWSV